jgi:hypothetical protein
MEEMNYEMYDGREGIEKTEDGYRRMSTALIN